MARSPAPGEVCTASAEPAPGDTPTPNWNEPRTAWPSSVLTDTHCTVYTPGALVVSGTRIS